MSRTLHLHLEVPALKHLDFLCKAYNAPARTVVTELLAGTYEAVHDALRARQKELDEQAQRNLGDTSDTTPTEGQATTPEATACDSHHTASAPASECGPS